jgi:sporulation protein YlmC with PRC-barrel domain
MAHVGTLRGYRFEGNIDDIRGSNIYNRNDDKLGQIDDVIFNHDSGYIEYLVVDTGGWLNSHKFLVPADHITATDDNDRYFIDLTKQQIEGFPEYNEKLHENDANWNDYENRYEESWTTSGGILHKEGSQNILTPDADEMPPVSADIHATKLDPNATADLSNSYPPEDRGRRWRSFEDNLRKNRVDITASCRSCSPAKDKAA